MAKLKHLHFTLIIGVVILLVTLIGVFRTTGPTGYTIQQKSILRTNLTVAEGVCILNVNYTNPTSVNYTYNGNMQLAPGVDTDEVVVNYTNAGNARQNVSINASVWAGPASLGCNQTRYFNATGLAWGSASDACGGNQGMSLGFQGGDVWNSSFLKVRIPSAQQSGQYNQNITYTSGTCGTT